jgi:drug/metabolite transporter (DMT)-like permease
MRTESNATPGRGETQGLLLGALGVLAFSFSLPATRVAVDGGLDPWLVAFGRATVAALLAICVLTAVRAPLPTRAQARRLLVVAAGVVVGFPLGTSLALETETATHGIVVVGLLPAMTACFAVARAGERPSPGFWVAAAAGLLIVVGFALATSGGGLTRADLLLLAGNAACALGYAEGGVLARELGGARTISWALVLALPLSGAVAAVTLATTPVDGIGADAWGAFAYVSVFSMFLGFFAWYAGLARGGIAKVGQVQLAQPVLGLVWAGLILGEQVGPGTAVAALGVLACVVATQRARVDRGAAGTVPPCPSPPPPSGRPSPRPSTP